MVASGENFKKTSKERVIMKYDTMNERIITMNERIMYECEKALFRLKKRDFIYELKRSPKEIKDIFRQNRERNNQRRRQMRLEKQKQTIQDSTNEREKEKYRLEKKHTSDCERVRLSMN